MTCCRCDPEQPHGAFVVLCARHALEGPDAISELYRLVEKAGGTVTLNGDPITQDNLRAAAQESELLRVGILP